MENSFNQKRANNKMCFQLYTKCINETFQFSTTIKRIQIEPIILSNRKTRKRENTVSFSKTETADKNKTLLCTFNSRVSGFSTVGKYTRITEM